MLLSVASGLVLQEDWSVKTADRSSVRYAVPNTSQNNLILQEERIKKR